MSISATFDGVVVGSTVSNGTFCIERVERNLGVSPDVTMVRRVANDGSRFVRADLPSRTIDLTIGVYAKTAAFARDVENVLKQQLFRQEPCPLSFSDETGTYYAILSDVSVDSPLDRWSTGTITFTCPDPFRYGSAKTITDISSSLTNVGTNWYVLPEIEVKPPNNSNPVKVDIDGQEIVIAATIPSSGVVFDSAIRETRVGGVLKVTEVSGEYPSLREGSVVTVTPPASAITLSYTERWL